MQIGLITIVLILEPVINEELKYNFDQLFNRQHNLPKVVTSEGNQAIILPTPGVATPTPSSSFGDVLPGAIATIVPVSTDFGIVIEKINANAKVVANVNPADEKAYIKALGQGVVHAQGTAVPGQTGNIYLFSHSTDAPWNIVRYNAIFFLLNKLEAGDSVIMFYQGRRYDYIVFDKAIAQPLDTHFLTDTYNESVLTLQTCDPPGTLINRLIVRARLAVNN